MMVNFIIFIRENLKEHTQMAEELTSPSTVSLCKASITTIHHSIVRGARQENQ
jgi:hypothetical protein